MIGLGTVVNTVAIIIGATIGILLKKGIPEKMGETVMVALAFSSGMIGLSGIVQNMLKADLTTGRLESSNTMIAIMCLVIGAIIGELLKIENGIEKLSRIIQKKFAKSDANFTQGFVSCSLIYCIGAMSILGPLQDALSGDRTILFAKSVMDGISSIIFATALGIGVAFSSISVLLFQGTITLLAGFVKPYLSDIVVTQMSLVGGVLLIAISLNILKLTKIRVGNLLPAIFLPILYNIIIAALKIG